MDYSHETPETITLWHPDGDSDEFRWVPKHKFYIRKDGYGTGKDGYDAKGNPVTITGSNKKGFSRIRGSHEKLSRRPPNFSRSLESIPDISLTAVYGGKWKIVDISERGEYLKLRNIEYGTDNKLAPGASMSVSLNDLKKFERDDDFKFFKVGETYSRGVGTYGYCNGYDSVHDIQIVHEHGGKYYGLDICRLLYQHYAERLDINKKMEDFLSSSEDCGSEEERIERVRRFFRKELRYVETDHVRILTEEDSPHWSLGAGCFNRG